MPATVVAPVGAPRSKTFEKSRYLLRQTVESLFNRHHHSRVLFVTLTFPAAVNSVVYAHKRLNSLLNAVRRRYQGYLWVLEPTLNGAVHYHLLIPVNYDLNTPHDLLLWRDRAGFSDDERLREMCPALREDHDWWQENARSHGFGRTTVEPIHSNAEAVAKYLSKAWWADGPWPFIETKHVRFWSCSASLRAGTMKFAWNSPGARKGRHEMQEWAAGNGCASIDELHARLGRHWGFMYKTDRERAERLGVAFVEPSRDLLLN